ncbi:2OG-Fe(II) oxygenase [bacterium]|nr:2OG-Fe(II) oxygenase [bacterium]
MVNITDEQWVNWIDALADDDYVIIDDFIPQALFERISQFFREKREQDDLKKAAIGSGAQTQVKKDLRGDFIYWLDQKEDVELQDLYELLEDLKSALNRYCFLSLSGFETHLALYPEGTYYVRHLDQFNNRNNRMISFIIYLNEEWQEGNGGELAVFKEDREILISPIARRCVMFRSDTLEHEVKLTHVPRMSITGWMLYQPPIVGQILT